MSRKKLKQKIMCRDLGHCQYKECNEKTNLEMAHRIADTVSNKKEIQSIVLEYYGKDKSIPWVQDNVIDHEFNVVLSCKKHNDYFNIGFKNEDKHRLIEVILWDIGLKKITSTGGSFGKKKIT